MIKIQPFCFIKQFLLFFNKERMKTSKILIHNRSFEFLSVQYESFGITVANFLDKSPELSLLSLRSTFFSRWFTSQTSSVNHTEKFELQVYLFRHQNSSKLTVAAN